MHCLFISTHFPANLKTDVQGTFKRQRIFIDALKEISQLEFLFFVPSDKDISKRDIDKKTNALSEHWGLPISLTLCESSRYPRHLPKWKQQKNGILDFRQQKKFIETSGQTQIQALETCLENKPDFIFCHRLPSMGLIASVQRRLPTIFFDLDDIEHVSFARRVHQPPVRLRTLLYYLQIPALFYGETKAIRKANQTFICSNTDRKYLSQYLQLPGIKVIPNAVSIPEPQPLTDAPNLMLLGGYYFHPNRNAADLLIEKIWPLVRARQPEARLIIAGSSPHLIRSYDKNPPGVEFTGFVENLDELYARTRVVCCPVTAGSGTRVKLVEAAAYGKPIVSTTLGAEGLSLIDEESYLQRDVISAFAEGCRKLLQDKVLAEKLGKSARKAAIENYDRSKIIRNIQGTIKDGLVL